MKIKVLRIDVAKTQGNTVYSIAIEKNFGIFIIWPLLSATARGSPLLSHRCLRCGVGVSRCSRHGVGVRRYLRRELWSASHDTNLEKTVFLTQKKTDLKTTVNKENRANKLSFGLWSKIPSIFSNDATPFIFSNDATSSFLKGGAKGPSDHTWSALGAVWRPFQRRRGRSDGSGRADVVHFPMVFEAAMQQKTYF